MQEPSVEATDDLISIEGTASFTAKQDAPDFVFGAIKRDESRRIRLHMDYDLRNGLISSIRIEPVTA